MSERGSGGDSLHAEVVLFASYSGALGGAERLLIDWALALDGETCLACPEGPLASAARAAGLRVFAAPARGLELRGSPGRRLLASAGLVAHARELRRLTASLDPELVVAWGMRSAIALLGLPRRFPVAFQHNDLLPGPVIGRLVRLAAKRAAVVTVPSRAVASDLDPTDQLAHAIRVIHPGIDLDRFSPDAVPARPPEVLVLGALVPWKRVDLALEACALARRREPELRVRIVGAPLDGAAADGAVEAIQARAARDDLNGAVELAGASADAPAELARATCLLHCADREPFGLAVLEALAAGRPAIVPAAAGPAEIADRSCAFLYPPGDADAAADALVRVVSDHELAARMGRAGRERARTHFDGTSARSRWVRALSPVRRAPSRAGIAAASLEIVTVTHESASALRGLLRSAERFLPSVRVHIVDCASTDETLEIARRFVSAQVTALEQNVGFARACNLGVADVRAPVVALLNPDVELLDDSLLALAAELLRSDRAERLLAPLVLSTDGSPQDTVHPVPGSPADLARSLLPASAMPRLLAVPLTPWRARSPRRVGWAVGCALLARTDSLRRLGPFDERFFLYGEDLDLGLRAAEAGVEAWFWPDARVLHHRAHSTGAAFGEEPFDLLARARREAVGGHMGDRRLLLDDGAQAVTFATRIAAKRALGRSFERERRQLRALRRARRYRSGDDLR